MSKQKPSITMRVFLPDQVVLAPKRDSADIVLQPRRLVNGGFCCFQGVIMDVNAFKKEPPPSHPLKEELAKIQQALAALEESAPARWADKLPWRGLR
jgi:hypothetical protein